MIELERSYMTIIKSIIEEFIRRGEKFNLKLEMNF
jgi:hypothetical protein